MDTKQAALDYRGVFLSKLINFSRGGISAVRREQTLVANIASPAIEGRAELKLAPEA
jgi:hypothetical protein